jgi:hypothetical protein
MSENEAVTQLATYIASYPAHAEDMGPENTVFADHIPMDGAELAGCPKPIERLAWDLLNNGYVRRITRLASLRVERGDDAIELKTLPEYFADVASGAKTFALRRHDRNVTVGSVLRLREWSPTAEAYTGRDCLRRVTYVLQNAPQFGLEDGFAIYALAALTSPEPGSGEVCPYCSDGKRTGLPGNACENCMNTGLASPPNPYDITGAIMSDPECYKELDGWLQERLCRDIAENLGLTVSTAAHSQPKPEHASVTDLEGPNGLIQGLRDTSRFLASKGHTNAIYCLQAADALAQPEHASVEVVEALTSIGRRLDEEYSHLKPGDFTRAYRFREVQAIKYALAALQAKPSGGEG